MHLGKTVSTLAILAAAAAILLPSAHAAGPSLYVSAENPRFGNHFAGSMVVEVAVLDPAIGDTGEGRGEPDVTLNGRTLRMAQAGDGSWYAYFANADMARAADSAAGSPGSGLDFGVFCGRDTPPAVFGIGFPDTDGFAVPSPSGLSGFADGAGGLSECSGEPDGLGGLNNVVRNARPLNADAGVPPGQIGLDPGAWPLIQLFSFGDVTVRYDHASGTQQVRLEYGEIPGTSLGVDRERYPQGAQVFLTVSDAQLNQDPTDEDSWTFGVGTPGAVFYQAFGGTGRGGGAEPADISTRLPGLGFEDNGRLAVSAGRVLSLGTNSEQPRASLGGAPGFSQLVTLVESGPNSGVFDTADHGGMSTISILGGAPRGHAGSITYDRDSVSVLTGPSAAGIAVGGSSLVVNDSRPLVPGKEFPVVLVDADQNLNSGARDSLDASSASAAIPTLMIGDPPTLAGASGVEFFRDSPGAGMPAGSSVPDAASARLFIDTSGLPAGPFRGISLDLGFSAAELGSALAGPGGTNWLNYDFRSLESGLGVSDFSGASIDLFFGGPGTDPVPLVAPGGIASPQGLVRLDVPDVRGAAGAASVVVDFGGPGAGHVPGSGSVHPIIMDFFSFGEAAGGAVNNAVYRFELEETGPDTSTFAGTIEYSVAGGQDAAGPEFARHVRTIGDGVKFVVADRLAGSGGIAVSYSDLDDVGVVTGVSARADAGTSSGRILLDSDTYRFGQPVTLTLHDPDLNLSHDVVDAYGVVDDPRSPYVDTVGGGAGVLLEVLIKDTRYKRCTVDGVEHGGLAATGFSLVETSADSGVFTGVFKMPGKICNGSGTRLVSTAGGSIDARYHDYRDGSGNQSVFSLSRGIPPSPQLSAYEVAVPLGGGVSEVVMSGSVASPERGAPLTVTLTNPDGAEETWAAGLSPKGKFRAAFAISGDTPPGTYRIQLSHADRDEGSASFVVYDYGIPDWVKDAAGAWSSPSAPDSGFAGGVRHLVDKGVIVAPAAGRGTAEHVPAWTKDAAGWWSKGVISDGEFLGMVQFLVKKGIIRV